MKRSVAVETEENDSSTETERVLSHTPRRMSDPEIETSPSEAVTSEDVERQIRGRNRPAHPTISSALWINEGITGCAHAQTSRRDHLLKSH